MKKILFGLVFLVTACSPFHPFTFVQMTDPQIGFELSEERTDTMFKAAVAEVNALDPALVVITGDLVNWALTSATAALNMVSVLSSLSSNPICGSVI